MRKIIAAVPRRSTAINRPYVVLDPVMGPRVVTGCSPRTRLRRLRDELFSACGSGDPQHPEAADLLGEAEEVDRSPCASRPRSCTASGHTYY